MLGVIWESEKSCKKIRTKNPIYDKIVKIKKQVEKKLYQKIRLLLYKQNYYRYSLKIVFILVDIVIYVNI